MKPGPYLIRGLLGAAAIVALGVGLSMARGDTPSGLDPSGRFRLASIIGGRSIRTDETAFTGGTVTTVMGGVNLDLRRARMAGDGAVVELGVVMGGVRIRVPEDWSVVADVNPVFGGVNIRTRTAGQSGAPRLVVEGTVFMGGVNITN